jgi:myo-inositol-1(or 4)-monophosphatase
MTEIEIARAAARQGGEVLMKYWQRGFESHEKLNAGFVTDADLESEKRIVETILAERPDHAVLGEEEHAGDVGAEHLWIVDPLDGTTNYAHRLPHFAVSIAYYHRGVPQCGVIWNPARDDWYETTRGGGAWHNGQRVHVSNATRLDQVLMGVGFYYDRGAMMEATLAAIGDLFRQQIHGIRRFGTAALDLCHVACGLYGGFFEYQLSPWDFAAGRLFVEEAGGMVTTCKGESLPIAKTHLMASNGTLHPAILEIVAKHCLG